MILGLPDDARAYGVEFDVTESGGPVGGIEHGGVEATLPEMAGVAMDGVAIGGVEAAQVHHKERNGVGLVPDGDQMEVIRHEGLGGDAHGTLLAAGGEEVEEVLAIGVAEEDSLTVVTGLGDMQPVARGGRNGSCVA